MSSYLNYARLIDKSAIGIRVRNRGTQTKYYRHPLVRNDWGTADKFRGAQGYYFAKGSYKGSPRLINFTSHPYWAKRIKRPLKLAADGRFTESSFTVYFDNENWNLANRHKRKVLDNYLAQPATDVVAGDPNFYQYLAGDLGSTEYYESYYMKKWNHLARFSPLINLDVEYKDTLSIYRYPSKNKKAFEKSNYNLAINSYYNYYLETFPPYEDVVRRSGDGAELLLPNIYMLESDIQNTGSVNYTKQLTLNNASNFYDGPQLDVWFLQQNQVSAEGNKMYYQQYAEALADLNANGGIVATKEAFNASFKNIAVLYPDLGILKKYNIRDDRGTPNDTSDDIKSTAFYPFYNEIIIGFDREDLVGIGGKKADRSLFTSLFASKLNADHVRSFITMVQLYIIENMRQGLVGPTGYEAFTRETINASGEVMDNVVSMTGQSETVCDLDQFILALKKGELDYLLDVYNESKEEMADGANYTILREWENEELFKLNIKDAIKVVDSRMFEDAIDERKRSLKEIFSNTESPSETIMYLIEKRANPRGTEAAGPIIQTIMISKDVVFSDLLKYIDTQVKYGVRYKYDIKQVRMIFGNTYSYDGVSFDFGAMKVGQGKAVGNALGFYAPPDEVGLSVNGLDPLQEYTYLAADSTQKPASRQIGHFVFKLPAEVSNRLSAGNVLPAPAAAPDRSSLGKFYSSIRDGTADLSGLTVELHSGYGVEGAQDGGMTGATLEIPGVEPAPPEAAPSYPDEPPEASDPIVIYKEAINILRTSDGPASVELGAALNEINTFFANTIDDGDRQKVGSLLAQMKAIRDSFKSPSISRKRRGTVRGRSVSRKQQAPSNSRLRAASKIYKTINLKVEELLAESTSNVIEAEEGGLTNKLLIEVLGSPQDIAPHSTATTFTGRKGFSGLNIRFRKT